jgi:uncharacterized protein
MLSVISPAKTLDFKTKPVISAYTIPELLNESEKLVKYLNKLKPKKLAELMKISASLAQLNYERYQMWHIPFTPENARQAILAFNGDVYTGLDATTLSEEKIMLSQQKIRILSGLYGILRPLDLIQPYRLEMGTKLSAGRSKDLYGFWGDKITEKMNEAINLSGKKTLVNLASHEYFKIINIRKLDAQVITPAFKDRSNGEYKIISIFTKKARGQMARFILENDIEKASDIVAFDIDGYRYNPRLSKPDNPVFTRN